MCEGTLPSVVTPGFCVSSGRGFFCSVKAFLFGQSILQPNWILLLTALKFCLYSLASVKILIFSEIHKLQSLFYFKIMLNYACEFSLAKLQMS